MPSPWSRTAMLSADLGQEWKQVFIDVLLLEQVHSAKCCLPLGHAITYAHCSCCRSTSIWTHWIPSEVRVCGVMWTSNHQRERILGGRVCKLKTDATKPPSSGSYILNWHIDKTACRCAPACHLLPALTRGTGGGGGPLYIAVRSPKLTDKLKQLPLLLRDSSQLLACSFSTGLAATLPLQAPMHGICLRSKCMGVAIDM